MRLSTIIPVASLVLGTLAHPRAIEKRATPTIYLAGDSTMANKGANDGKTDGMSDYAFIILCQSLTLANQAGVSISPNM